MNLPQQTKPNNITKQEVYSAWLCVKKNKGSAGIDRVSIEKFEANLSKNLYKLWNRMSSGSYFPQAVERIEIPKSDGSKRPLGIPTVSDRIAQTVVRARLEREVEPLFHQDSYGFRPRKSAIDAIKVCRERNWKNDWVIDLDIEKFFDTIDHNLLMKAVEKHSPEKWIVLYIERWLKSPVQHADGRQEAVTRGTPQGGVISPLLANLYMHYVFDMWMQRKYPSIKFERFADDVIIHCATENQSKELRKELEERFAECGLKLHPTKTQIVYCKDYKRKIEHQNCCYTFLGYTFRPRRAKNSKYGNIFTAFLPAVSQKAQKGLMVKLKTLQFRRKSQLTIENIALLINPIVRGWLNYFTHFYPSAVQSICFRINRMVIQWVMNKYKVCKRSAINILQRVTNETSTLFVHSKFLLF
jgi:RNA-directed DNA polymerase